MSGSDQLSTKGSLADFSTANLQSTNPGATTNSIANVTMNTEATDTRSPVFPAEIISLIIANLDLSDMTYPELAQLWVAGTAVSTLFQEEIHKVFAEKLMPELTLEYNLGDSYLRGFDFPPLLDDLPDYLITEELIHDIIYRKAGYLNMSLAFKGLSMDGSRAIYKSGRTMNPSNGAISAYAAPVREFLTDIESSFLRVLKYAGHEDEEYPLHIIQLHGVFNDARLPGFSVDIEKREIEFDWRGLLSRLFREEVFAAAEPDAIETFGGAKGIEELQEDKRKVIRQVRFNGWLDKKLYRRLPPTLARSEKLQIYDEEYALLIQNARERMGPISDRWW